MDIAFSQFYLPKTYQPITNMLAQYLERKENPKIQNTHFVVNKSLELHLEIFNLTRN